MCGATPVELARWKLSSTFAGSSVIEQPAPQ